MRASTHTRHQCGARCHPQKTLPTTWQLVSQLRGLTAEEQTIEAESLDFDGMEDLFEDAVEEEVQQAGPVDDAPQPSSPAHFTDTNLKEAHDLKALLEEDGYEYFLCSI
jgi:hypothetical protein